MFIDEVEVLDKRYLAIVTLAEYYSRKDSKSFERTYDSLKMWGDANLLKEYNSETGVYSRNKLIRDAISTLVNYLDLECEESPEGYVLSKLSEDGKELGLLKLDKVPLIAEDVKEPTKEPFDEWYHDEVQRKKRWFPF